jgi:hypothetical protein
MRLSGSRMDRGRLDVGERVRRALCARAHVRCVRAGCDLAAVLAGLFDTHNFTIDLHTINAVGIGTLLLAVATFWMAVKTRRLAKEAEQDRQVAQRQVDTAQEQLEVAQRQVEISTIQTERAHRPVVVPVQRAEQVLFRGGGFLANQPHLIENDPNRSDLPRYSAVHVPVENVGMGPALNLRGTYLGPRGSGHVMSPTEGLAAGRVGVVSFESWADSLAWTGNHDAWTAELLYDDVAGTTYTTEIVFEIGNNAFRANVAPSATPPLSLQGD